jgi:hypothetical protein
MMRDFLVIIQLLVVAQSYAQEFAATRITEPQVSMDRFVDDLMSRARKSPLYHDSLDQTTFAKPSQHPNPTRNMPLNLLAMPKTPVAMQPSRMIAKRPGYPTFPMGLPVIMEPANLQNQRRVGLRANPIRTSKLGVAQIKASSTVEASKTFELKKPLGLTLEPNEDGKGAKIVEVQADGNADKAGGIDEDAVVLSIDGKSTVDAPYEEIMDYLGDVDASAVIKLEVGVSESEADLAPGQTREVKVKLLPEAMQQVRFSESYTKGDGYRMMMVDKVPRGSRAWQNGVRPKMALKSLKGGAGAGESGDLDQATLKEMTMRQFNDKILLSLKEMECVFVRGLDLVAVETAPEDKGGGAYSAEYGFGNALDQNQKDIVIWGSLAAFFGLFMSGYLLN